MTAPQDPILLTPGPLTTSRRTKEAMLSDYGSRDMRFIEMNRRVRAMLLDVAHARDTHVAVPLQGSGTFAVEAMLGTLVPRDGHVLVPANGAYCQRIARILGVLGRRATRIDYPEEQPVRAEDVARALEREPSISHVALVHCETSTGMLNPLAEVAGAVAARGRGLLVDAMSSFGALEIDAPRVPFDALVAASGKCLEGPPGMGFALVRRGVLERCAGNAHSLVLDLHDQWTSMEKNAQWRFTPPTHVLAALHAALEQFAAEGGQPARGARYRRNCEALVAGMTRLGFRLFLEPRHQAPIIVTFHAPGDPGYRFQEFYDRVRERGYVLYPGKLTQVDTLRVGCIGHVDERTMQAAVQAIGETVREMGITRLAPEKAAA